MTSREMQVILQHIEISCSIQVLNSLMTNPAIKKEDRKINLRDFKIQKQRLDNNRIEALKLYEGKGLNK